MSTTKPKITVKTKPAKDTKKDGKKDAKKDGKKADPETNESGEKSGEKSVEKSATPETHEVKKTAMTKKAGLNLNVNLFKSWLKSYYVRNEKYVPVQKKKPGEGEKTETKPASKSGKGEEEETKRTIPKLKGAYIAMAAATEVLCKYILDETIKLVEKETSGLYKISRPSLRYSIAYNNELRHLFNRSMEGFDKNMMYADLFCIPEKEMTGKDRYIESCFGKHIQLESNGYSLLAYVLNCFLTQIAENIYNIMSYSKKRSLDFDIVSCAIKNMCDDGIENMMKKKIEQVKKLCAHADNEDEEDEDADEAKTEGTDTKDSKKTTGKTTKKPPAAKTTKAEDKEVDHSDDSDGDDDKEDKIDDKSDGDKSDVEDEKVEAKTPPSKKKPQTA